MNSRFSLLTVSFLAAMLAAARAGDSAYSGKAPDISIENTPSRWRFGVGYAPLIGLKTEFTGLGIFNSPFTPQPVGGGVDYNYDNGFVRVDSSGNLNDQTWNWGYVANSQFEPADGGFVGFTQTNSLASGSADERDNAGAGIELFTTLDMGPVTFGGIDGHGARWGLRAGLHYARINVDNSDRLSSGLATLTDRFALNDSIPPLAPYSGSFAGPGLLISDNPLRSFSNEGQALVTPPYQPQFKHHESQTYHHHQQHPPPRRRVSPGTRPPVSMAALSFSGRGVR